MRTIGNLMTLAGRRALLTGAAGHIGLAIGETLVELGASVALLDRDTDACRARAQHLSNGHGGTTFAIPCDLMDQNATRKAVKASVDRLGGLDVLIHSAGFVGTTDQPGWAVPFDRQTVEAWDAAIRVNLTAAFVLTQASCQFLADSGHGAICLVGSIYGLVGPDLQLYEGTTMTNPVAYGASKGGLVQLTRYLATMLAPAVRVNCVSPGGVRRNQPSAFVDRYVERTPLRRMGTEEDVKGAIAYLVTDASAYVTGHNLVVDGGWTAW